MNIVNVFNLRRQNLVAVFLLGAFLTGCATVKSGAHHDEFASFDDYQSFAWIADNPLILGDGGQTPISPLARKEIVQSIKDELTGKGFNYLQNPDQADFVVVLCAPRVVYWVEYLAANYAPPLTVTGVLNGKRGLSRTDSRTLR